MEKAIKDGNISEVNKLLDGGLNVNSRLGDGNTPLYNATANKNKDIVKVLLDRGADPNIENNEGYTPLITAAWVEDLDIVKQLIEKGGNVNKQALTEDSPLGMAITNGNVKIVELLIDSGADVNLKTDGQTPLLYALAQPNKNIKNVQLLLDKGADPNEGDDRFTPLLYASMHGDLDSMKVLLDKGANPNKRTERYESPLTQAAKYDNKDGLLLLLEKGADINAIQLTDVIKFINVDILKILLDRGLDPNKKNTAGLTPLMILGINYYRANLLGIVKELLEHGADPNIQSSTQQTTALIALMHNVESVDELLKKGADPNIPNIRGDTPLMYAAKMGNITIVKWLLEKGADPNKQNVGGETALMAASRSEIISVVRELLLKGANPNIKNKDGKTALDYAKTDEIRTLLGVEPQKYTGKTKTDIDFFSVFLGQVDAVTTEEVVMKNIKNTGFCPVCLEQVERSTGCLYMHHVCEQSKRHEELYQKYKDKSDNAIWWCVDCCRICDGHKHYAIGLANGPVPSVMPDSSPFAFTCDSSDKRDKEGYVNPETGAFINPAKSNGGGSTPEKLKRVARMIDYAFELQHFVGELSSKEAKNELVEETWNAATMRLRFDPLKFKRWKTDLSVFTEEKTTVSVVPEAIPQAGDIDTPTVDNGTDFVSLDDGVVIQFKHKNKDGVIFNHVHGDDDKRFIGKESLLSYMKTMGEKLGKCFDDDCGGWLWPQEIEMAFSDAKLKDTVTDEDRKVLAAYKERFNAAKAPKTGGAKWKFNFLSDMENGQCYLPRKNNAGNRTRKNKKRAKKTRSSK